MKFFRPKPHLVLYSKEKGKAEQIVHQPADWTDEDFINGAVDAVNSISADRIDWFYILDTKTNLFVYDFKARK